MWAASAGPAPAASARSTTTSLKDAIPPSGPTVKKHARNVYAHTREECEEKLKTLIVEMKAEIAEAQRLKDMGEGNGRPPEEKKGRWGREQK